MAIAIYRERCKPSAQLAKPYVLVGMNVIAAESDDEARRLATTQQMSFANIFRGPRTLSQPPIDDIDSYWSQQEKGQEDGGVGEECVPKRRYGVQRDR